VGGPVARVSGPLPLIGQVVALVGEVVALVGGPLAFVEDVLGPVQGGGASGQPGLGRLQGLLGLLGSRLGRPDPGVVDGQGRDPLALGLLDDLLGQLGQLARGRPGPSAELLEGRIRAHPPVTARTPFGLLDPDPVGQRLAQLGHLNLPGGHSTPVLTSSAVTTASAPNASTSEVDHTRGRVTYTSRVPTGWSASRTGTLNTARTRS
jgi:hypothetical protein